MSGVLPLVLVGPGADAGRWRAAAADPVLAVESVPSEDAVGAALARLAATGAPHAVVVDARLAVSRGIAREVARAVADPALAGVPWAVQAGRGVGVDGAHHDNGGYLDAPALAGRHALRALAVAEPAPALVSLAAPLAAATDLASVVTAGWGAGFGSFLSPHLRFSFAGPRAGYPAQAGAPTWGAAELARRLDTVRPAPTVTIVVRTALRRPELLRRTMASLAAAGGAAAPPERVLLAGTVPAADLDAEAARLRARHPGLPVEALAVAAGDDPPRTAAVVAAVTAADTDYVWFVDDDDVLTPRALQAVRNAVHARDTPLVLGPSVEVREQWRAGRLVAADEVRTWDPAQWPRSFTGWNMLPFCSMVLPRRAAASRLADVPLRNDLGEDYALLLLVLTAPGQTVVTVTEPLARVSIRPEGDNVVTATDREEWLRSITAFVGDLAGDPHAGAQAVWSVGRMLRDAPPSAGEAVLAEPAWRTWGKRIVPARLHPAIRRVLSGLRRPGPPPPDAPAADPAPDRRVDRTLVLLCRNQAGRVVAGLDELLRRGGEAAECLVVDEGSTDGTIDRAADARAGDGRVRLFEPAPGTAPPAADLVGHVGATRDVAAYRAGDVLAPVDLAPGPGTSSGWPAGWVELREPERLELGEADLAAAVTGRAVLLPGVAYHVDELGPLGAVLDEAGVPAVFAVSDHRWEGVRRALRRYRTPVARCPAPGAWLDGAAAVVTLNDWAEVYRDVVLAAKERGIPTFGKVEGVQDFADDDVGWQRRPYRTVDHVLCQGTNDVAALAGADTHVVGSSRLEALWRSPAVVGGTRRAVINLNFTYGVLEEQRGPWLESAVAGCQDAGLPFVLSVHPAEPTVPDGLPVSPWPVSHALATSTVLISRFSTVPFEAIARGVPFVYHNPHGEQVPTFTDGDDAFPVTTDAASLAAALASAPPPGDAYRRRAAPFFARQVDIDPQRSPAVRAADVVAKFLR